MARLRRSIPEAGAPSAAEAEIRQLELARNQNDQKLKSRFERIFRKYEHDFTDVGDEIDIESGEIVVDNGHLQNMRDEADPGQSKSASSRFVRTFQEKLGHEGEDEDGTDEDDEDSGEEDGTDDSNDSEDGEDEGDGTDETDDGDGAGAATFERIPTVEPFRALKRPPPRLAQLLVGGAVAADDQDQSIEDSASETSTSTPTGLLAQVPALQASMSTLAAKAKRPAVDTDTIQALGLTIANQLAQLMAGTSKKRKRKSRPASRSNTTDPAWHYPEIARDRSSRRKQPRTKSPVPPVRISSPAAASPEQRSLWAPEGRQKKLAWKEANVATPPRRVLRSSLIASSVLKKEDVRRCGNCSLTNSTSWQPGPDSEDLCASCAKYYDYHGRMKPFDSPTPSVVDVEERESSAETLSDIQFESARSSPALTEEADDAEMDLSRDGVDTEEQSENVSTAAKPPRGHQHIDPVVSRKVQVTRAAPGPHANGSAIKKASPRHAVSRSMGEVQASTRTAMLSNDQVPVAEPAIARRHDPTERGMPLNEPSLMAEPLLQFSDIPAPSPRQHQTHANGTMPQGEQQEMLMNGSQPVRAANTRSPLKRPHLDEAVQSSPSLQLPNQPTMSPSSRIRQSARRIAANSLTHIAPMPVQDAAPPPPVAGYGMLVPAEVSPQRANHSGVSFIAPSAIVPPAAPNPPASRPKKSFNIFVNESPSTLYTANTSRVVADADTPGARPVPYTVEESAKIIRLKEFDKLSWHQIAIRLPGRTMFSIQKHYCNILHDKPGPGRDLAEAQHAAKDAASTDPRAPHDPAWDDEQDELLLELREDRELDWDEIADIMTNHSEDALEIRYDAIVNSSRVPSEQTESRNFVPFTAEEDALVVRLREVEHITWSKVAQYFEGRQLHSIQKRYSRFLAPEKRKLPPVYPHETTLEERIFQADPELEALTNPRGHRGLNNLSDRAFNAHEDEQILQLRAQSLSWKAIASQLRGRSAENLQIRHAELLAGREKDPPKAVMPSVRRTDTPPRIQYRAASNNRPSFRFAQVNAGPFPTKNHPLASIRFYEPKTGPAANGFAVPKAVSRVTDDFADAFAAAGNASLVNSAQRGPGTRYPFTDAEDDVILQLREMQGYEWDDIAMQLPGRSVKSITTRYAEYLRPVRGSARVPSPAQKTTRKTRQSLPATTASAPRAQSGLLRRALRNSRRRSDFTNDLFSGNGFDVENPISLDDDDDDEATAASSQQLTEELHTSVSRPVSLGPAWTSNHFDVRLDNAQYGTATLSNDRSVSSEDAPRTTVSSTALQQFLSRAPQQPSFSRVAHFHGRTPQSPEQTQPANRFDPSESFHDDTSYGTPARMSTATEPYYAAPPVYNPIAAADSQPQADFMVYEQPALESSPSPPRKTKAKAIERDEVVAKQQKQSEASSATSPQGEVPVARHPGTVSKTSKPMPPAPNSRVAAREESLIIPEKPKFSMRQLVHMAFQAIQSETMFAREINRWIQNNFEYYRAVPDTWKSAVRVELNTKHHFEPVQTSRGREFRVRPDLDSGAAKSSRKTLTERTGQPDGTTVSANEARPTETTRSQELQKPSSEPAVTSNAHGSRDNSIATHGDNCNTQIAPKVVPPAPMQVCVDEDLPIVPADDDPESTIAVQSRRGRPRGSRTMRKYHEDDYDEDYTPQPAKRIPASTVATRRRLRQSSGSVRESGEAVSAVAKPDDPIEIADSDDENNQKLSSPAPQVRSSEKRVHFRETVEVRRPVVSRERPASSDNATSGERPQDSVSGPQDSTVEGVGPPSTETRPAATQRSSSPTFVKPSAPAIVFRKPKARVSDGAAYAAQPAASSLRISQLRQYETPRRASTGMPVSTPRRAGTPTAIFAYRASPAASGVGDRFGFGRRVVETPVRELADPNEDELA